MRRVMCVVLLAAGFLALVHAGESAAEDPWAGKSRSDVETLLGKPTKTKDAGDGTEVLIYKFVRLHEGAVAPVGMSMLNVPGVGVVGQMPDPGTFDDDLGIEPTRVDKYGRGVEGGMRGEDEYSVSYDTETKKVERSWEERPSIRGKVTLRFRVNADGEIESWSVSPKKAAASG